MRSVDEKEEEIKVLDVKLKFFKTKPQKANKCQQSLDPPCATRRRFRKAHSFLQHVLPRRMIRSNLQESKICKNCLHALPNTLPESSEQNTAKDNLYSYFRSIRIVRGIDKNIKVVRSQVKSLQVVCILHLPL